MKGRGYMLAVISKWGNSQGIRLNKTILEAANLDVNDSIEISIIDDGIMIKKCSKVTMKSLFDNYEEEGYVGTEYEWDEAKGKEIW